MKYTYKFSDEENTIEIDSEWKDILSELDKEEFNQNRAETRRHEVLDISNEYSSWLKSIDKSLESFMSDENDLSMEESLHIAISKLKPKQRDLIVAIYFKHISVNDFAAKEGVKQNAISMRLARAKNNLKKFLEKPWYFAFLVAIGERFNNFKPLELWKLNTHSSATSIPMSFYGQATAYATPWHS